MRGDEAIRRWLAGEPIASLSPKAEEFLRREFRALMATVEGTLADAKQAADGFDDAAMELLEAPGETDFERTASTYKGAGFAAAAEAIGHMHNRLVRRITGE